jgi:hypothetical protein
MKGQSSVRPFRPQGGLGICFPGFRPPPADCTLGWAPLAFQAKDQRDRKSVRPDSIQLSLWDDCHEK